MKFKFFLALAFLFLFASCSSGELSGFYTPADGSDMSISFDNNSKRFVYRAALMEFDIEFPGYIEINGDFFINSGLINFIVDQDNLRQTLIPVMEAIIKSYPGIDELFEEELITLEEINLIILESIEEYLPEFVNEIEDIRMAYQRGFDIISDEEKEWVRQ